MKRKKKIIIQIHQASGKKKEKKEKNGMADQGEERTSC